jgi:hypothetical protein
VSLFHQLSGLFWIRGGWLTQRLRRFDTPSDTVDAVGMLAGRAMDRTGELLIGLRSERIGVGFGPV